MSRIENKNIRRIYRNQSEAVVNALWEIFAERGYADKVIERTLKADRRRGSGDRAFIAETVYGVVRYRRLLEVLCDITSISSMEDIWRMMGVYILREGGSLPPWSEFEDIDVSYVEKKYEEVKHIRAIRESIPDWMDEIGARELPNVWDKEIEALNRQAQVIIRANALKTTREALKEALEKEGVRTREVEGLPYALEMEERK
ncbi:MAG: RNA methyltransferase, partial [Flavobacteriales bacterium]|nr:RNA methyltransferase [Flavobacteriales bacterium]